MASLTETHRERDSSFSFGRNWQRYVSDFLTPEREAAARESLRELLATDLEGKVFLDIGAGSGLFSLAAYRLGAREVVSMDVDPASVACCRRLHAQAGAPEGWSVIEGSILDDDLVERLPEADVVYSWGVLHHTGDMAGALRHAASRVKPGGLFCIAIYNRVSGRVVNSDRWRQVKRAYNRASPRTQLVMRGLHRLYWSTYRLARLARLAMAGRNPVGAVRNHRPPRGMARTTDLLDWLGGYPYEFATADEIVYLCERQLGFELVNVVAVEPHQIGNNEFVFRRPLR